MSRASLHHGITPLTAVLRCHVASRSGVALDLSNEMFEENAKWH